MGSLCAPSVGALSLAEAGDLRREPRPAYLYVSAPHSGRAQRESHRAGRKRARADFAPVSRLFAGLHAGPPSPRLDLGSPDPARAGPVRILLCLTPFPHVPGPRSVLRLECDL